MMNFNFNKNLMGKMSSFNFKSNETTKKNEAKEGKYLESKPDSRADYYEGSRSVRNVLKNTSKESLSGFKFKELPKNNEAYDGIYKDIPDKTADYYKDHPER